MRVVSGHCQCIDVTDQANLVTVTLLVNQKGKVEIWKDIANFDTHAIHSSTLKNGSKTNVDHFSEETNVYNKSFINSKRWQLKIIFGNSQGQGQWIHDDAKCIVS